MIMNKRVALIAICCIISINFNQAESLVEIYANEQARARQIPGSEPFVKDYFSTVDADTIYAIAYKPANCARCESMIIPVESALKKANPSATTVLISASPDKDAAQAYNIKKGFGADYYIYDVAENYSSFLSFSSGFMSLPYLMKIDKTTGVVIAAVVCMDNTDEFIQEFVDLRNPFPQERFLLDKGDEFKAMFIPPEEELSLVKTYKLSMPDTIKTSEIVMNPAFGDAGLFFNDKLRMAIMMYEPENDDDILKFRAEIRTNSDENRRFVEVNDTIYAIMSEDNGVHHIPLTPMLVDGNTLAVSYSLPKIFHTDHGTVGYMNQAVILLVDTKTLEHKPLIPLLHSGECFYRHYTFSMTPDDVIVGYSPLTWPWEYERAEYESTPDNNPFTDAFYSKSNPLMGAFGIDSWRPRCNFGELPPLSEKSRTGYYFCSNFAFDYSDGEMAWTDGVSGLITIADRCQYDKPKATVKAFTIPDEIIPAPDSTLFHSLECTAPYKPVFCRTITGLKLAKDKIHCLVRYGDHSSPDVASDTYTYVIIDRGSGVAVERRFPVCQDSKPMAYGLRHRGVSDIAPYRIIRSDAGDGIKVEQYAL